MALTPADLTTRIEQEFATVWQQTKGSPLPGGGAEDRRLLFAAVARGVLAYLKAKEDDVIDRLTVREAGGDERDLTVVEANLDIGS
jgi:hypothetical protein